MLIYAVRYQPRSRSHARDARILRNEGTGPDPLRLSGRRPDELSGVVYIARFHNRVLITEHDRQAMTKAVDLREWRANDHPAGFINVRPHAIQRDAREPFGKCRGIVPSRGYYPLSGSIDIAPASRARPN